MKEAPIKRNFSILFLVSSLFVQSLQSQENQSSAHLGGWFSMGLGKSYFGPTSSYNLSLSYNDNLVSVRYLSADEHALGINPGGYEYDRPSLSLQERGVLYGRSFRKDILFMSISVGIGFISGIDRGKKVSEKVYEPIEISSIGMPFEARFRFNFGLLGVGGAWFGDINSQKFLSGGLVEISIGVF